MTLEELLNKLIQMGWKPFWKEIKKLQRDWDRFYYQWAIDSPSLRDLVSIESGFRQFVCEKRFWKTWYMANEPICTWTDFDKCYSFHHYERWNYKYRLMLSSIQTDLEKFILDNVLLPK